MKLDKYTYLKLKNTAFFKSLIKLYPYLSTKEDLYNYIKQMVKNKVLTLGVSLGIYLVIFYLLTQDKSPLESLIITNLVFGLGVLTLGLHQIFSYVNDYPLITFFYFRVSHYYLGLDENDLKEILTTNAQFNALQELELLGIKKFCKKHFNQSGPGFIRFYQQRALVTEVHGRAFINYSLSIPKAKEMNSDQLRKVLLSYDLTFKNKIMDLNLAFKNYSVNQIEQIFTTPGNRSFLELNTLSEPFPLAFKFSDLERLVTQRMLPQSLQNIHMEEISGFLFKVLITQADYNETSDLFSNCVRNYWGDERTYIITVFKKLSPLACIELQDNSIRQIAGIKDRSVLERSEICVILKERCRIKIKKISSKV